MKSIIAKLKKSEKGSAAIEFGFVASLIILLIIGALAILGPPRNDKKPMSNAEIYRATEVCNRAGLTASSRSENDATVAEWCSPGPFHDEIQPNRDSHD